MRLKLIKSLPLMISIITFLLVVFFVFYHEIRLGTSSEKSPEREVNYFSDLDDRVKITSLELPEDLYFAGERVPIEIPDVRERLERELHINTYWHSSTIFLLKRGNRWLPRIEKILKENNIPEDFKYLPAIEGGFKNSISPKNAVGFWQFIKSAGKENGLIINSDVDERYDPLKSTKAACNYLNTAYKKFYNWTIVAASYNRGMSGMAKSLAYQQVNSYYDLLLNDETSRYVFRILAIKEIFENPMKYGFDIDKKHLLEEETVVYIEVENDINDLVSFAKNQGINYKLLKLHNPWLRDDDLKINKGIRYQIAIPVLENDIDN